MHGWKPRPMGGLHSTGGQQHRPLRWPLGQSARLGQAERGSGLGSRRHAQGGRLGRHVPHAACHRGASVTVQTDRSQSPLASQGTSRSREATGADAGARGLSTPPQHTRGRQGGRTSRHDVTNWITSEGRACGVGRDRTAGRSRGLGSPEGARASLACGLSVSRVAAVRLPPPPREAGLVGTRKPRPRTVTRTHTGEAQTS